MEGDRRLAAQEVNNDNNVVAINGEGDRRLAAQDVNNDNNVVAINGEGDRRLAAQDVNNDNNVVAINGDGEESLDPSPPRAITRQHRSYSWSIASISFGTFLAAVSGVLALPLFPARRHSNDALSFVQIALNILAIVCLYKCKTFRPGRYWKRTVCNVCMCIRTCVDRDKAQKVDPNTSFNYLAKGFFIFYLIAHFSRIVNDFYFIFGEYPDCAARKLLVAVNLTQLVLAFLLFTAITVEPEDREDLPDIPPGLAHFQWAICGATCMSTAFSYFMEEATWGYLEIMELSMEYPEYGLNLTHCSAVEDCVDPLLKARIKCIDLELWPLFSKLCLEVIPITAEFFALGTFFCVIQWGRVGKRGGVAAAQVQQCGDLGSSYHVCNEDCMSSISQRTSYFLIGLVIAGTIIEICIFKNIMHFSNTAGVWIFVGHLVGGQVILLLCETCYYVKHLKGMRANEEPPVHQRLNIMLLVFPLLPLGVLYILQIFPRLALTSDYSSDWSILWTIIDILKALLHCVQAATQSMFISQVFCTVDARSYSSSQHFFFFLGWVNVCIWFGWTFMCKDITLMGNSSQSYGVVPWTIIVYFTVPFALFCYAHAAACCFEIFSEAKKHQHKIEALNNDPAQERVPLVPHAHQKEPRGVFYNSI